MDENTNDQDIDAPKGVRTGITPLIIIVAACLLAILWLVLTKSPGEGGPTVILLFLLLTFVLILSSSMAVLRFLSAKTSLRFSWIRVLYTSVAIAAGIVFLVGLRTLRQLQVVDVVLVMTFELLLNFYLLRRF